MSANALKTLREPSREEAFDGAYYICGEDDFQKEDAVRQLIEAAIEPGMRDFNMEVIRAQEQDAKSLDAALSALPMMADRQGGCRAGRRRAEKRCAQSTRPLPLRTRLPMCLFCLSKPPVAKPTRAWRGLRRQSSSTT